MICKILRLFINTFTAQDKYSVLNREYLTHAIHMQLSQKQQKLSQFFAAFLRSRSNFGKIKKKERIHSWLMYYPNYRLAKTWLHKYQKSTNSEYPWTSNMVNLPKHR